MARVTSLDEASILALFDAKRAEDLSVFGTQEDAANARADINNQGILIASNHSDILAAQASIASHGTTIGQHASRLTNIESDLGVLNTGKPVRVTADTGGNVPANTVVGVGTLNLVKGSSVFTAGNNGLFAKMPGLFVWNALFYMPAGGSERQGFANPPDENGHFDQVNIGSSTGTDRETLAATAFFDSPGKAIAWEWRSNNAINGCTFNVRGIFFPLFINT